MKWPSDFIGQAPVKYASLFFGISRGGQRRRGKRGKNPHAVEGKNKFK
jgi:hypothetical protein